MKYYEYAEGVIPNEFIEGFVQGLSSELDITTLSDEKIAYYCEPIIRIMCDAAISTSNNSATESSISVALGFKTVDNINSLERNLIKKFNVDSIDASFAASSYVSTLRTALVKVLDTINDDDFAKIYSRSSVSWAKEFGKRVVQLPLEFTREQLMSME